MLQVALIHLCGQFIIRVSGTIVEMHYLMVRYCIFMQHIDHFPSVRGD
jgi:hypothetical protein